jgi:hypothetical protein
MLIKVKLSALAQGHWYEYLIRFVLGGSATALTGLTAAKWGPAVGGLFLAFPAIFPASATLVEKHEREKKEKVNLRGDRRGREAAALEAAGAVLGSLGLIAFGVAIWQIVHLTAVGAFAIAGIAWLLVSFLAWTAHKRRCFLREFIQRDPRRRKRP